MSQLNNTTLSSVSTRIPIPKTDTKVDQPSFEKINKYNVAIQSLKNQLKQASSLDELTILAGKIIELEQQIVIEKSTGYKQLEKERKDIEQKIDKIRRELHRAEADLSRINNTLDFKINGYKKTLQAKIDSLGEEYNLLASDID